MSRASTLEVYERWAPGYAAEPHNPLMVAEQRAMIGQLPDLAGLDVLDLACGTGRYSVHAERNGARSVIGVDLSPAMLAHAANPRRVRADMCALPLRDSSFDLVISGLALGHAADLAACTREIARVLRDGGRLLYSDFHPEATVRGLRRAFRDRDGQRFELPPDGFVVNAQHAALCAAGFTSIECLELRAGIEVRENFPGAVEFYERWHGIPLVLIVNARRAER